MHDAPLSTTPIPPPRPALAKVLRANVIEAHASWDGLGNTFDGFYRLERVGSTFKYDGKYAAGGTVGEPLFDPTAPKDRGFFCLCALAKDCACERSAARASGRVPELAVTRFLGALAARRVLGKNVPLLRSRHTDDYPAWHVVVRLFGEAPLHFSCWYNSGQWLLNGRPLDAEQAEDAESPHPLISQTFFEMMRAAGLYEATFQSRGRVR